MTPSVAVLGLGRMGTAVARRLVTAGLPVTVWNRTPTRTVPGSVRAPTPAEATAHADLVLVLLNDAAAVSSVLAAVRRPDLLVVQMSTISPTQTRSLAREFRLPSAGSLTAGRAFLDAPVLGSVPAVEAGTLTLLVGGADDDVARAVPVLSVLGTVRRCGPVGAGSAVKLVANAALATGMAALTDVLSLADAAGVDRQAACDVLSRGALSGAVARARATGAQFPVTHAAKDVDLALDLVPAAAILRAAARILSAAPDPFADLATLTEEKK